MTTIKEFRDLWDESIRVQNEGDLEKRDELRSQARHKAEQYVDENEVRLSAVYGSLKLEQIVQMVDFYRTVERLDDVAEADMWLLAYFEPQNIGGTATVRVRRNKDGSISNARK